MLKFFENFQQTNLQNANTLKNQPPQQACARVHPDRAQCSASGACWSVAFEPPDLFIYSLESFISYIFIHFCAVVKLRLSHLIYSFIHCIRLLVVNLFIFVPLVSCV